MNLDLLQRRAQELDAVLRKYEPTVPDARRLRSALGELIAKAEKRQIQAPITTSPLPGSRLFDDGTLGELVDLANAFGKFAVEVSGGPPPGLQEMRRRSGKDPLTGD